MYVIEYDWEGDRMVVTDDGDSMRLVYGGLPKEGWDIITGKKVTHLIRYNTMTAVLLRINVTDEGAVHIDPETKRLAMVVEKRTLRFLVEKKT